jgi:hypothetical protein
MRKGIGSPAQWLLILVLLFQVSILSDTLAIKVIARAANLVALVAMLGFVIFHRKPKTVSKIVAIPIALVFIGYAANVLRNASVETIGYAGMLLPWIAALAVPFVKSHDLEASWRLFFRFMFIFASISCVEYAAVFTGMLTPTLFETDRGEFYRGFFTLFHALADGSVYDRMYGVFPEPGTFAMFLMPAIAYALVRSKILALAVFMFCLFMTGSLGGFASLVVVVTLFIHWRTRRLPGSALLVIIIIAAISHFSLDFFVGRYEAKGLSATVREDNVLQFYEDFSDTILRYPLGSPLAGRSLTAVREFDVKYVGSNFSPYTALLLGGIIAFGGYLAILAASTVATLRYFAKGDTQRTLACVFISLPPLLLFVFQRTTIVDSALFAFLFVPAISAVIRGDLMPAVPEKRATRLQVHRFGKPPHECGGSIRDARERANIVASNFLGEGVDSRAASRRGVP